MICRTLCTILLITFAWGPQNSRASSFAVEPKCYLFFEEFDVCANIQWPDAPLALIENTFDLIFYETESMEPAQFLPKVFLTVLNFYENRWVLEPLVGIPKDSHYRHVTELFFDKPGLWYIYVHLSQEDTTEAELMKIYLEDF